MGAIEPRPIEILTLADTESCLPLSAEPGWNQNAADWRLFMAAGTVLGIRGPDGSVIATAAILPYGRTAAWISLVLVTASMRRQRLATRLMEACLALADRSGRTSYLDATPAGAHVYRPLGFEPVCGLVRLRRPAADPARGMVPRSAEGASPDAPPGPGHAPAGTSGPLRDAPPPASPKARLAPTTAAGGRGQEIALSALLALDREALGVDRSTLFAALAGRPDSILEGDERACCLVRGGRVARHVGPVYGRHPDDVAALLARVAEAVAGELIVDAYEEQTGTRAVLAALGFSGERPFTRLRRGPAPATSRDLAHAGAGPEYG